MRLELIKLFGKQSIIWIEHNRLLIIIVLLFVTQYIVWRWIKQRLVQKYKNTDPKDQWDESYIMYYKKLQVLKVGRFIIVFFGLLYLLASYQSGFFSIFAIATGATIITFQSFVLSFWVYFYLLMQYRVGDTIRVGTICQWEIIYIEPLYTSISSKNNDGDHTGELIVIPNNQMRLQPITRVKLLLSAYTKYVVRVAYYIKSTNYSFDDFVLTLESFLNGYLPNISRRAYNNYESYRWFKYKLDFEMGEYKDSRQIIYVDIGFLTLMKDASLHKKAIISFVDGIYHTHSWEKEIS